MVCELVGGWGFWMGDEGGAGDGGGAGGSAGDELDAVDVVNELSDWRLDDREELVDVIGTIVSALIRGRNRPLLSRVMYFKDCSACIG
jgi:N-acetylglucosamine kinase-like BadF-type ATPase